MRPNFTNKTGRRHRAASALMALFALAWISSGLVSAVTAQGPSQLQWNSTEASGQPWSETGAGARFDPNVQPADFRSAPMHTVQAVPPADFSTQSAHGETSGNSTGDFADAMKAAVDLEFALTNAESSGQEDWSSGFREMLRSQTASINWTRMLGSLAIVVGGWFLVTWLFRMVSPRTNGRLPASVFELVGSARLNSRQSLQLVRVGSRLLMLIVSPEGAQAVGEISHPGEVETLVAQCESGSFRRGQRSQAGPAAVSSGRDTTALLEQLVQSLQKPGGQRGARTEFEV